MALRHQLATSADRLKIPRHRVETAVTSHQSILDDASLRGRTRHFPWQWDAQHGVLMVRPQFADAPEDAASVLANPDEVCVIFYRHDVSAAEGDFMITQNADGDWFVPDAPWADEPIAESIAGYVVILPKDGIPAQEG